MHYSIIDVETTGFRFQSNDRIVEIGIVKIDESGDVLETFETLINPGRDVGPTHIHNITAEMLTHAPKFSEISNRLLKIIDGTIVVAHNARFDVGFLDCEFKRANHQELEWPYICTLDLARDFLSDLPSKKLERVCDYYDIEYVNMHSAMSDSLVTSVIFQKMKSAYELNFSDKDVFIGNEGVTSDDEVKLMTRRDFKMSQDNYQSPLKTLIDRLPEVDVDIENERQYLSILDDILLDRIISESELNYLLEIAVEYGISKGKLLDLNRKYLENLIRVYLDDSIISLSEKKDIEKVKNILMLQSLDTDEIIEHVRKDHKSEITIEKNSYAGKTVCFTGSIQSKINGSLITKKVAYEIAVSKGLLIKQGVVKKLDYLVLADVHSQSGKAKKARQYGTTLIAESAFWNMLGVQVE